MIIAIDLDEVLAETLRAALFFHNEKYATSWVYETVGTSRFWQLWGGEKDEMFRKSDEFIGSSHFKNIVPVAGAVDGVKKLRGQNHQLFIVTTRPSSLEDVTQVWVEKYFPDSFNAIHFSPENGKSLICKKILAKVLFEDDEFNALECASQAVNVFLFDKPWNKELIKNDAIHRASDWSEIPILLESIKLDPKVDIKHQQ